MKTLRLSFLVIVPSVLIGWILYTLTAPAWVWCVFALYTFDRAALTVWGKQ